MRYASPNLLTFCLKKPSDFRSKETVRTDPSPYSPTRIMSSPPIAFMVSTPFNLGMPGTMRSHQRPTTSSALAAPPHAKAAPKAAQANRARPTEEYRRCNPACKLRAPRASRAASPPAGAAARNHAARRRPSGPRTRSGRQYSGLPRRRFARRSSDSPAARRRQASPR